MLLGLGLPHARGGVQSILAPHGRPRPQCRAKILLCLDLSHDRARSNAAPIFSPSSCERALFLEQVCT